MATKGLVDDGFWNEAARGEEGDCGAAASECAREECLRDLVMFVSGKAIGWIVE